MSLRLRPARSTDAGKLGAMMTAARAEHAWKPRLHSAAEDIAFVGQMIERGWITVAVTTGQDIPLGFLARDGGEVNALFVAPGARGRGIGRALLDHAKAQVEALRLWTFQANRDAARFYRREGFVETRRSDGRDNDENLPDIALKWRRPTSRTAQSQSPACHSPASHGPQQRSMARAAPVKACSHHAGLSASKKKAEP